MTNCLLSRRLALAAAAAALALTGVFPLETASAQTTRPAPRGVAAPGAALRTVREGFSFTEGPASDAAGNVFFTDQPNDRLMRWDADTGAITTFLQPCGRSNGLCFDPAGNLVACADEHNQLWSIAQGGRVTVLVKDDRGKLLNGPNDVWVRPDGGIYITDPIYKRDYWTRDPAKQLPEQVYFLPAGGGALVPVATDLKKPNGIIGTPDGRTLYVADIGAGRTFAYDVSADGTLANKRSFCAMGSDGMTIDDEGNVYLTGRGVTVFDKTGKQIDHVPVPQPWTGNICFGGADRRTLFITASKAVYTLQTRIRGVGSQ